MKEIYKINTNSVEISINQANMLDSYIKIYVNETTNKIVKEESYNLSILSFIFYYITNTENELEVVEEQLKLCDYIAIVRINIQGEYTIENLNNYNRDKNVYIKERALIKDNKLLCIQGLKIDTDIPIFEDTIKGYYQNDDFILEATYKEDGSIDKLTYLCSDDEREFEYYDSSNFKDLQNQFEEDLSYYFTAEFLPKFNV